MQTKITQQLIDLSEKMLQENNKFTSSTDFSIKNSIPSLAMLCYENLEIRKDPAYMRLKKQLPTEFFDNYNAIAKSKENMLQSIYDSCTLMRGRFYGGYVRDFIGKTKPRDLDIKFRSLVDVSIFIDILKDKFNVRIIESNYNGCVSIQLQDKHCENVVMLIDATHKDKTSQKIFDFDVNMLETRHGTNFFKWCDISALTKINPKCNILDIIRNICAKQFIVLSNDGHPIIEHTSCYIEATYDQEGNVTDFVRKHNGSFRETFHCIEHSTPRGKKLLERIAKMESRGWKCLNKDYHCNNPTCIFSTQELRKKYREHLDLKYREKKFEEKEIKLYQQLLIQEKLTKRLAAKNRIYNAHRQSSSFITDLTTNKKCNFQSYETRQTARKKYQTKKLVQKKIEKRITKK